MSSDRNEFLNLTDKPAISIVPEASHILGLPIDGILYIEKVDHLKALANPPPGAQRYFSTAYLLKLAQDEKWLAKAVRLIRENTRQRNQARKKAAAKGGGNNGKRIYKFTNRG